MKPQRILAAIAVAIAVAQPAFAHAQGGAAAAPTQPKLKVGSPAPEIKVAKWLKGKGQGKFEKGKIYVVEFWATWCGPCIESIPHVTEMAKKYKDVSFTGVSVWETEETTIEQVQKFVDDMGAKMDYNVGIDDNKFMAENWMMAAGEDGIPSAFIVDKDGSIAWIGHPMEMDKVLGEVVAGKFDRKAFAAAKEKEAAEMAELQKLMEPVMKAIESGDLKGAIAEIDKVIAKKPAFEKQVGFAKLNLMMASNDDKTGEYAETLATKHFNDDAATLNSIAWALIDPEGDTLKAPKSAIKISERSNKLTENKNAMFLDTLALAYFLDGQTKKAVEVQELAIKHLDDSIPAATRKEMEDRLAEFKKKLNG